MAEAYFGLRRTRKRTHPVRCPCCNSEDEPEHHANDQKQEEASVSESSHARPKRSKRNILKKEKEVNKNTGSEKARSCKIHGDNDSEKSSMASGSRSSSRPSSPAKEKPAKKRNDKAGKSVAAHRNSKAKISCDNLVGKVVKTTEGKTPDKIEMSSKKVKKKETPVKTKSVVKNSSKKGKTEDKQLVNVTETKDNPSMPQNKKNKKSLPSKTSSSNNDTVALKDITKKETTSKEKRKGPEQVSSDNSGGASGKSSYKKLVATKPSKECVEFDDSDELPLSVTKASVVETQKSSKKEAKNSKKSTAGSTESTPRDFGTRKIRISYCNFDEVSRSKLEAFDHLFQELKKCPGYSKLTIASAVDMLTRIDKEQLKLIIKPKQSKGDKSKSSASSSVTPKPTEQLSPPVKRKRSTSTNSEENTARKGAGASTSKDKARKSGSSSKQKIDAAQKGQEMNECQAAEALLNFKSKPAVSRLENITGTDTNVLGKEEEMVEIKTEKQSISTCSLATDSNVIGSVSNTIVLPAISSNLAAETLLQIQTTAAQMLLSSAPVTKTAQSQMQTVQHTSSGLKIVAAHMSSSSAPRLMDKNPNEMGQEAAQPDKAEEITVSITDQATKAMDSLAHIFDQNRRQFGGFPTVMPQNPNFNPVTWAQTIPANIGQFSNVSTTLPSSICPLTPQAFSQLTPQAFTQMASHVFGQVMPQAKQQLLPSAVQGVLTGTPSTQQAFLPTTGQLGLGLQQTNQATPIPITEAQPNQQAAQPKSQLPLKSMEEIVGNVGQAGLPQPVGWSFPKSQAPVVYLASPQTLGGVPRNIVPATQSPTGVHLGQENMYKPISAKVTTAKPELAPVASRITQGSALSQGQPGLTTVGKRPILPREQGAIGTGLPETRATHRLPLVVPQVTNPIPVSVQTCVSSPSLVPSRQRVVSASMAGLQSNTTPTTTMSAKQAVKNLVRERTKSAELKRQDSSCSTSSRSTVNAEPVGQGLESAVRQRSPGQTPLQPRRVSESACDNVTSIASTVNLSALQSPQYQGTRPNEFNLEQAASALLSIGKTESPEGHMVSQGNASQDGHDEKVVFTSKGMFRVGDVEVDPQYNRIGREGYTCGKCSKIFTSLSYLARHIKRVCPDMSCRKWKCNQCDKAFRHPFGLQQHVYTHTGERPHKCPQCPKAFYSSNDLRRHSRIHSGERPYKCKHCEKSFATTISLKTHTYIHTGEKPHKCPHCPKTFATSSKLGRHIVTHSEQRPFSCHQCPKSFNRSGDLRRHSLHVHESHDKPFECDECNKPFATSVCLKIHKNMHRDSQASVENEKPFKCSTCDRTYDSATQLDKHHLTHIPSAPLGYNYKQFHPIAPKPSGKLDEMGSAESTETKHSS